MDPESFEFWDNSVDVLIQTALFIALFASYSLILRAVLALPSFFSGAAIAIWIKVKNRDRDTLRLELLSTIEGIFASIFLILFLSLCYSMDAWDSSWILFWNNPVLIGLTLIGSTILSSAQHSYNPFFRAWGRGVVTLSFFFVIILAVGQYSDDLIHELTVKIAITVVVLSLVLMNLTAIFKSRLPSAIARFQALDARHDKLIEHLKRLEKITFILGDIKDWQRIQDAVAELNRLNRVAQDALRRKQFDQADEALIQAESEVSHVDQLFQTRLRFSIREDLQARMDQAELDIETLGPEFIEAGLSASSLDEFSESIKSFKQNLPQLDTDAENLLEQLQEYESLFHHLLDIKTALRFRRNVDSMIDNLKKEILEKWEIYPVAEALGLNTAKLEECRERFETTLDDFQSRSMNSGSELVSSYQILQDNIHDFREVAAAIKSAIDRGWNSARAESGRVRIYVPKLCSSTGVVRAAVQVEFEDTTLNNRSFNLDGALVELSRTTVIINRIAEEPTAAQYFEFNGRRGGTGTINVEIPDGAANNSRLSFHVHIIPSVTDTAQKAILIATPSSGLAGLAYWWLNNDGQVAALVGTAALGLATILTFFWRFFKYEWKYKRRYFTQ